MRWSRVVLVLSIVTAMPASSQAGLFNRKPKATPAERVPVLIQQLQSDPDEQNRTTAAVELRQYDARTFKDIVPTLVQALLHDASASVRATAAESIGKLRPISQEAGNALEKALNGDQSMRVRFSARTALWQYHLAGYRGGKPESPVGDTDEPPLAPPGPFPPRTGQRVLPQTPPPPPPTPAKEPSRWTPGRLFRSPPSTTAPTSPAASPNVSQPIAPPSMPTQSPSVPARSPAVPNRPPIEVPTNLQPTAEPPLAPAASAPIPSSRPLMPAQREPAVSVTTPSAGPVTTPPAADDTPTWTSAKSDYLAQPLPDLGIPPPPIPQGDGPNLDWPE